MGQVWRAADQKLGREVALRVLNVLDCRKENVESTLHRETCLLAQLKHPGIVTILDSGGDVEHSFLVMELVEGTSLDQVIQRLAARGSAIC